VLSAGQVASLTLVASEETTAWRPLPTLRENTDARHHLKAQSAVVTDPRKIVAAARDTLAAKGKPVVPSLGRPAD